MPVMAEIGEQFIQPCLNFYAHTFPVATTSRRTVSEKDLAYAARLHLFAFSLPGFVVAPSVETHGGNTNTSEVDQLQRG